jgi:hypothetical protein
MSADFSTAEIAGKVDYLGPLQQFLDKSTLATIRQLTCVGLLRSVNPARAGEYDEQISAEIAQNVEVAGTYMQDLAASGKPVCLRIGEILLPVQGLAYQPNDGCYSVGVLLGEGYTLLPLNGEIGLLDLPF